MSRLSRGYPPVSTESCQIALKLRPREGCHFDGLPAGLAGRGLEPIRVAGGLLSTVNSCGIPARRMRPLRVGESECGNDVGPAFGSKRRFIVARPIANRRSFYSAGVFLPPMSAEAADHSPSEAFDDFSSMSAPNDSLWQFVPVPRPHCHQIMGIVGEGS